MDASALTLRSCPQCQHENHRDLSRCERCHTPLPATFESLVHRADAIASPAIASPAIASPAIVNLADQADDTNATVTPQIEASPTQPHGDQSHQSHQSHQSQTLPRSVTLPPINAKGETDGDIEIDPHLPTAARLQHETSEKYLALATDIFVWRVGKPHHGAHPDLDISAFPQAEIVSRSHALIRYHRGQYYIEDMNSSNGTYVNNQLLVPGRHYPLNHNDCIALGKGDLVRFFFQICAR